MCALLCHCLLGYAAAAYAQASGITAQKAQQLLNCDWHIPSKAFFVITHANYEHHDCPLIVLYRTDPLADCLIHEFSVAPVNGEEGKFRQVFCYGGKLKPPQKKAILDKFKAAVVQADLAHTPPPVLLAQIKTFGTGTDGLQVGMLIALVYYIRQTPKAMQLQAGSNNSIRWQSMQQCMLTISASVYIRSMKQNEVHTIV
jgi:hypothetical protein